MDATKLSALEPEPMIVAFIFGVASAVAFHCRKHKVQVFKACWSSFLKLKGVEVGPRCGREDELVAMPAR